MILDRPGQLLGLRRPQWSGLEDLLFGKNKGHLPFEALSFKIFINLATKKVRTGTFCFLFLNNKSSKICLQGCSYETVLSFIFLVSCCCPYFQNQALSGVSPFCWPSRVGKGPEQPLSCGNSMVGAASFTGGTSSRWWRICRDCATWGCCSSAPQRSSRTRIR